MNANKIEKGFNPNRKFSNQYNCIDFALGNNDAYHVFNGYLTKKIDPEMAFSNTLKDLGISFKQISKEDIDSYENQYIVCLYWWEEEDRTFGFHYTDFHVVRKNPDGCWLHKSGFKNSVTFFPESELEDLMKYEKKAFFVIKIRGN